MKNLVKLHLKKYLDKHLNSTEAAKLLKISTATLYKRVEPDAFNGGKRRYLKSRLLKLKRENLILPHRELKNKKPLTEIENKVLDLLSKNKIDSASKLARKNNRQRFYEYVKQLCYRKVMTDLRKK